MQYQRHNFAGNFLNMVHADKPAAWDILINEINEVILDYPKEVETAILQAGHRLPAKPSAKDKLDVISEKIYQDEALRKSLLRLISKRHQDPHYSADGGEFDKVNIDGQEKADFNMTASTHAEDENTMNFVFQGAKALAQGVKDKVQVASNKLQAAKGLSQKEKQRNLPVSRSNGTMSMGMKVGIGIAVIGIIGTIAFLAYRSQKTQE